MNQDNPPRTRLRSAAAILAGFIAVVALSLGTDALLREAGIFPALGQSLTDSLYGLATLYRTIYGIAGSYLTARLAPNRPMWHALLGGFIGLVISSAGAVATWNKGPEFGPHWYPLALVVTALPCAWLGGRLYELQSRG